MNDQDFLPALRFHRLTPLFDAVAAVTVRDGALKQRVLTSAALQPGMRVLDVGCGTGTLALAATRATPGLHLSGLDADPAVLRKARQRSAAAGVEISWSEGRATDLPYDDESFDAVLSTLFFHHLPDDAKRTTAGELRRVLRPGGVVVVGDLGRPHGPMMRSLVRGTVQLFDGVETTALNVRGDLPQVLAGAGFGNVAVRDRLRTPTGTYEVVSGQR